MKLIDVYDYGGEAALGILWRLLAEREPEESISHRAMPSWAEHVRFVGSRPYRRWMIIEHDGQAVGAVYLTAQGEIGIGTFKAHRQLGFATDAVVALMAMHPGERFLANINPANTKSIALFEKMGFTGPIQVTYERR